MTEKQAYKILTNTPIRAKENHTEYSKALHIALGALEKQIAKKPTIDKLTDREILALRAVAYGANTNRKLVAGNFCVNIHNPNETEMLPFDEAIKIVYYLIDRFEKGGDDNERDIV